MNEYWIIVRRRKLLIFACVVGGLALAGALNELTTPVYRSSVRVEVQRETSRSLLTGAVTESPTPQSDNQALLTTAQIVTSRVPMTQVVEALDRQGTVPGPGTRRIALFGIRLAEWQHAPKSLSEKIDWLLAHVTVEAVRDSRLIRISVENSDPAAAAVIANTVADNFVRYHLSQRSAADDNIAAYLRTQASDVSAKIQDLERKTQGSNRLGLFSLEAKIQQLTASAGELYASYTKTTTERFSLSSQLDRIRAVSRDPTIDPSEIPIHTEALDALRRDLLVSNASLAKARDIYGSSHPKLVLIRSENDEIKKSLRAEVNNAFAGLESQRFILVGREVNLQTAIAQVEDELRSLNEEARKYSTVEGELKSNGELYNLLMSRVHEAEITARLSRPLVRVIEPASMEPEPVRPRKPLNIAIGLVLGMLLGAGLAFLLESHRKTIRTPKDVDEALQLPVLGLIPKDALR